jgi:hypothetical protein
VLDQRTARSQNAFAGLLFLSLIASPQNIMIEYYSHHIFWQAKLRAAVGSEFSGGRNKRPIQ